MAKVFYAYILTNPAKTVFCKGMSGQIKTRLLLHIQHYGNPRTFAGKYHCRHLIYFDEQQRPYDAICRENQIKKMTRAEKIELIRSKNPDMDFLEHYFL